MIASATRLENLSFALPKCLNPWSRNPDVPELKVLMLPMQFLMVQIVSCSQVRKVDKILEGSLDLIQSPSPSVKIQIIGKNVCLRYKDKTLQGVVNKLLEIKSLLKSPSNVLPNYLQKPFPPII